MNYLHPVAGKAWMEGKVIKVSLPTSSVRCKYWSRIQESLHENKNLVSRDKSSLRLGLNQNCSFKFKVVENTLVHL